MINTLRQRARRMGMELVPADNAGRYQGETLGQDMMELLASVQAVFQATNAGDSDAFVGAFTPDGVINDWGRVFRGHDGIRSWNHTDNIGVHAHLEPTDAFWDHDEYVVTATVSGGGFNGQSHFRFRIAGDRVSRMTIRG